MRRDAALAAATTCDTKRTVETKHRTGKQMYWKPWKSRWKYEMTLLGNDVDTEEYAAHLMRNPL